MNQRNFEVILLPSVPRDRDRIRLPYPELASQVIMANGTIRLGRGGL